MKQTKIKHKIEMK